MTSEPATSPTISLVLWFIGGLTLITGCIAAAMAFASFDVRAEFAGVVIVFGLILIGFGTVIDRLSKIEIHLRPENRIAAAVAPEPEPLEPIASRPDATAVEHRPNVAGSWPSLT